MTKVFEKQTNFQENYTYNIKLEFFGHHGAPNKAKVMWVFLAIYTVWDVWGKDTNVSSEPLGYLSDGKRRGQTIGFDPNLRYQAVLLVVEIIIILICFRTLRIQVRPKKGNKPRILFW